MIFEEVSAKSGINVEEAFSIMAREIKNRRSQKMYEETGVLLKNGSSMLRKQCSC
jgi:type II secretory pathway component PulF